MFNRYFFTIVAFLFVGGICYYQYDFYRSPVLEIAVQDQEFDFAKIVAGNPHKDGIPAINDPVYESVYTADVYLDNNGSGLVVESAGQYRFYPYQILVWHEVVNDVFAGKKLLISYCPLCNAGAVYERNIDTETLTFGVSGKVWNGNTLLYDTLSESYWSQLSGKALTGDMNSKALKPYPQEVMTWSVYKTAHPGGQVLSRETGFDRDYTQDPYELDGYYESADIWFTLLNDDFRLPPKEQVFGILVGESAKVYRKDDFEKSSVINDHVDDTDLVLFWDNDTDTPKAFTRQVDEKTLTFEKTDDFLKDIETGSLWNYEGEAVSGDYRGIGMNRVIVETSFWYCWSAMYPQTSIYQSEN